ncbi:MAG: hypothetical protein PHS48_06470, partial [Bacteroidales bacterium]|nr:hypothetical protein [Bacteroidales bacterium]
TLTIHSLNRDPEYYFEVEAFDSGTEDYKEITEQVNGRGAEIELAKSAEPGTDFRGGNAIRKMTYEGVNEYIFDNILPGEYTLRHTFGPVLWKGTLTSAQLIGSGDQPTVTASLTELGVGTKVLGQMELKVIPGKESGKIVVITRY